MAQTGDEDFFEVREDWSRRKHLILEHYLPPATAKLRRASPDGRVIILDGFAGRGRYDDGTPGSPVQMGQLADKVRMWRDPVDLRIFNVEAAPGNHAELEANTQQWVSKGIIRNYNALFSVALPSVLAEAATSPLFAFLDPFRSAHLPFDDMEPLLTRTAVTEMLIVFHTPHVRRVISQVRSQNTSAQTRAGSSRRLNAIFGGSRWERFLTEEPDPESIVRCFIEELVDHCRLTGKSLFICDTAIEARHGHNLKYHIIFITRHRDGVFLINDAFVKEKRDAHSQSVAPGTTPSLFAEYVDPMDTSQRPAGAKAALLEVASAEAERQWSHKDFVLAVMVRKFGLFSETEYKQAMRDLLQAASGPRLVGVEGQKLKNGKWKVGDGLVFRLEK